MANEQNLKPLNTRAKRVQREIQSKGGKARAEKIRERKTLREELLSLLEQDKMQEKISLALLEQAGKGNTKAYEIIRDTIGEKPKENINVSGEVNNPFAGMSTDELRKIVDGK